MSHAEGEESRDVEGDGDCVPLDRLAQDVRGAVSGSGSGSGLHSHSESESESDSDGGGWPLGRMSESVFEESEASVHRRDAALAKRDLFAARKWSLCGAVGDAVGGGNGGLARFILRHDGAKEVVLHQIPGQQQMVVWDCAVVLARYLERHRVLVQGKRVVELGCGLGLPGLVSGALGAEAVLLTERELAIPSINQQIDANTTLWPQKTVTARGLGWSREYCHSDKPFDVVLCSDLIYAGDSATTAALAHVVAELTKGVKDALVVSCFEVRHVGMEQNSSSEQDEKFCKSLAHSGFGKVENVEVSEMDSECHDPNIKIKLFRHT
mmetsp:Transcript_5117/g.9170  ORF Transcript_5117/g.9170 Transcript_5117/m.9170 type:complete len:324 (-) Transcript_5117:190-1161(-)